MKTIHWIRLDIPYQSDGNKMRAVVGHSVDDGTMGTFVSAYSNNIPNVLSVIKGTLKEKGLKTNQETVLVYPLDGRIDLALAVKEIADKEGWKFERHLPIDFYPSIQTLCSFEQEDTGSTEDNLSKGEAQRLIFQYNNDAQKAYQSSDLPQGMSCLRQALQLAIKHFGWDSPGVAYSLTNFGHVMNGTGNNRNIQEATVSIERMLYHWDQNLPLTAEWRGAESILEQLMQSCNNLGATNLSTRLESYKKKLFE